MCFYLKKDIFVVTKFKLFEFYQIFVFIALRFFLNNHAINKKIIVLLKQKKGRNLQEKYIFAI
jgi:hypothetical protein